MRLISALLGVCATTALLSGCGYAQQSARMQGIAPQTLSQSATAQSGGRYYGPGPQPAARPKKYDSLQDRLRGRKTLPYQTRAMPVPGGFQQWVEHEPQYTLYPGDQIDIVVASAPELSRTLTVGPDGRVVMPMTTPIMASGRTFQQVQSEISRQLSKQLRDPTIAISPRAYAPEQVYVGGEVGQPGTYTLPGPVGAVETIFMAGGLRPTAAGKEIAILRRAPVINGRGGGMMMRTVNLNNGLNNIREYNDNVQLRRGDIVFVPRTTLAEVGVFMQNFRSALPVDFNLSYQVGSGGGDGTTFVTGN